MPRLLSLAAACALLLPATAFGAADVDPLTASIHTEDADRFAALFADTDGKPDAAQLQKRYLDPGSEGVRIFTPNRIRDAAALAAGIAKDPGAYRTAIEQCLPVVKQASAELRSIYLGLRGLFPARPLPEIYIVFGRGNSGGTAGPSAQVLGLEVLCRIAPTPAALRQTLRMFFAHETVHTWQGDSDLPGVNPLLADMLREGAADYIASLVLGTAPNPEREAWGLPREGELWAQFRSDLDATAALDWRAVPAGSIGDLARHRWVANVGKAPAGWPPEMGYWLGMRIWQRYVERSADKRAALERVLNWTDGAEILARGAFQPAQ